MIHVRAIDVFSHQGFKAKDELNHYNEDRFVASNGLFAVIDGATSVVPHDMDGLNASAYTSEFARTLFEAMAGEEELTATDILLETNTAFGEHLKEDWPEVAKEGKAGPCAGAALFKFMEDGTLSFAQVADCIVLLKRKGQWHQLTPDTVAELDNEKFKRIIKLMGDAPMSEMHKNPKAMDVIRETRSHLNTKHGMVNGEPQMKKFVMDGEKALEGVEAMALMSDGMAWPEAGEKEMYIVAAQKMEELGVRGYWQKMKKLYDNDPEFEKYLRFKHMDDATAMVVYL